MKKYEYTAATILFTGMMILCAYPCPAEESGSPSALKVKAFENEKYGGGAGNFDPVITLKAEDPQGNPIVLKITLLPDTALKIPKGISGLVNWQEVSNYESRLIIDGNDPYAQWFIENLWIDRINRVLAEAEKQLRAMYPGSTINISVEDIADALGMDTTVGFLSGQEFIKIPNSFGGRVPPVDIKLLDKLVDPQRFIKDEFADLATVDASTDTKKK